MFRPLPELETIRVPVLLLMSSGATFAHAARTVRVIVRFSNATTRAIDCHHWPLTEKPPEVRQAIEDWIARRLHSAQAPGVAAASSSQMLAHRAGAHAERTGGQGLRRRPSTCSF